MASGSENSNDSLMGKNLQTNGEKKEESMDGKENIVEKGKMKDSGSLIKDESKIEEGMKNGEEKKEDVKEVDVGMKNIDEVKKEDLKEINGVENEEAKKGDEKKNDEAKLNGDVNAQGKIDEAKKGATEGVNETKNDEAKINGDVNEMKNDEEKKRSEKKLKEDEKNINEVDVSVVKRGDEVLKDDGEGKTKNEENDAMAVQEKTINEGEKERVVNIDQNSTFAEKNDEQSKKNDVEKEEDVSSCNVEVSNLAFDEESNLFSDLKDNEKKALLELRSKVEQAINENKLFKTNENDIKERNKEKSSENNEKEMAQPKENEVKEDAKDQGDKTSSSTEEPTKENEKNGQESKEDIMQEGKVDDSLNDIKLWGVPLSKGGTATDVVLLKFLRARDFKVMDAFEMLKNAVQWRKENNMDLILDEDLGSDFCSIAYINGRDRQGHPVCYNVFGVLDDNQMYNKTLGTEENREKFLRWRLQLMEQGIQKLDFNGTVSSLLQINDLKNTPGPSKKEVRLATKQVVGLLQDNYPEFVAKNIFINVPFWYYAFTALLSPFLTQRTKSKFVYARPAKVADTLLKYIDAVEIPVSYGGLKRDNDSEFSTEDRAEEFIVKASSTETIEIPLSVAESVIVWDLVVSGWEVNYKEEFIPDNEKSYTILIQKEKKMGVQEGSIRNTFKNNEPGKVVLVFGNATSKSKKRAFYRYKIKDNSSST